MERWNGEVEWGNVEWKRVGEQYSVCVEGGGVRQLAYLPEDPMTSIVGGCLLYV